MKKCFSRSQCSASVSLFIALFSLFKVTPHGLVVEYLSSFTGMVDFLHIEQDRASSYKSGDKVRINICKKKLTNHNFPR